MAAKGSILKQEIVKQILDVFGGKAFLYNDGKEIRINGVENGENLQVKVTLTCAKVPVLGGAEDGAGDSAPPVTMSPATSAEAIQEPAEPTEDEKARLANLLAKLGL